MVWDQGDGKFRLAVIEKITLSSRNGRAGQFRSGQVIGAVLDSNVYLSAVLFGGNPRAILEAARAGIFEPISSPVIGAEIERVLREKFGWPEERIEEAGTMLWRQAVQVTPTVRIEDCSALDDNRVLEGAYSRGFTLLRLSKLRVANNLKRYCMPDGHGAILYLEAPWARTGMRFALFGRLLKKLKEICVLWRLALEEGRVGPQRQGG